MKKRLLMFMSLLMLVCVGAKAADNVAKIGETEYETLQAAIDAATSDDVVTVLVAQTTAPVLGSGKTVKINWNGTKNITPTTVGAYYVASSSATVEEVKIYTYVSKEAGVSVTKADGTITYHSSLQKTLSSGSYPTGSTVTLLKDETETIRVNCGSSIIKNRTITIDLGGHTYTNTAGKTNYKSFCVINGNNVTIKNGTMNLADGIYLEAATLTIDADATINGKAVDNSYPTIFVYKKASLTVKGTVTADKSAALQTHGTDTEENTIVINEGATVTSNGHAVYFPSNGSITVNGTVSGDSGIEMKGGTLIVGSTASITATATETDHKVNKSGSSTTGYAIAVVESKTYQGSVKATVLEGAIIKGPVATVVDSEVDDSKKSTVSITGGKFSTDPTEYCAKGYTAIKPEGSDYYVIVKTQETIVSDDLTINGEPATEEQIADVTELCEDKNIAETINDVAENANVPESAKASYVKVVLNKIKLAGQIVSGMSFDVKPVYLDENGEEQIIENASITGPITFRLPVPALNSEDAVALVWHGDTILDFYPVSGDEDDGMYIELASTEFSSFSYKIMKSNSMGTIYTQANQEGIEEQKFADFKEAKATYPNAVMVVEDDEPADYASVTNVIVKSGKEIDPTYTSPNFVLTDDSQVEDGQKADYYSPYSFTASKLEYTRLNAQGLNSVCLPFDYVAENGYMYTLNEWNDNMISFIPVDGVGAGYPFVLYTDEETLTYEDEDVEVTNTVYNPHSGMKGSFTEQLIGEGKYKVNTDGTAIVATTSESHTWPFRAYFEEGKKMAKNSYRIELFNDVATAISEVSLNDALNNGAVYNVNGTQKKGLSKGLNIIKGADGKAVKVVVK